MNELEELKARAAGYEWDLQTGLHDVSYVQMKADLDRAIAIAERKAARVEELRGNRLDEVEAALGRSVELVDRLARERDKAIAAALALRDAGKLTINHLEACEAGKIQHPFVSASRPRMEQVLDETAWLEEHR